MTTKKDNPTISVQDLKVQVVGIKLKIKAGIEKNTNAHKRLKKQIAQLITRQTK